MVTKVDAKAANRNVELIQDTAQVILNDVIPRKRLINTLQQACSAKQMQRGPLFGQKGQRVVLLESAKQLTGDIQGVEMRRSDFLDLLAFYVDQDFDNNDLYNNFIVGFGNKFADFQEAEAIRFLDSLYEAGFRQEDITEAVVEKVLDGDVMGGLRPSTIGPFLSLLTTVLSSNATEGDAFQRLVSDEGLKAAAKSDDWLKAVGDLCNKSLVSEQALIDLIAAIGAREDLSKDTNLTKLVSDNPCRLSDSLIFCAGC